MIANGGGHPVPLARAGRPYGPPVTHSQNLDTDPYRLAIVAAERLRAALDRHGLTLLSLRGSSPEYGRPWVELGGCDSAVAERLADLLEKAEVRP
jgi:hypothetical protein